MSRLKTVAQECGSTLPAPETVRKEKLQDVRTFSRLSHESHAARTIPSAVFHPALRISKENNDDEIYYFNQASTFKSRLSSTLAKWHSRSDFDPLPPCMLKESGAKLGPGKQSSVYLETINRWACWLAGFHGAIWCRSICLTGISSTSAGPAGCVPCQGQVLKKEAEPAEPETGPSRHKEAAFLFRNNCSCSGSLSGPLCCQ